MNWNFIRPTRTKSQTITFVALLAMSNLANAEPPQNTWANAKSHLSKNAGMVAQRIATEFSLPGDDAQVSGRYVTVVSGASPTGEPMRELHSTTDEGQLGMKMAPLNFSIAISLANQPNQLFESVTEIKRLGEEHVGGGHWEILEVKSAMRTGNAPIRAKVWINKNGGNIWKLTATIEKSILPGVRSVSFAVTYKPDSQGRSLPSTVTVDYPISILFHTGHVSFSHEISDWKAH